MSEPIQIDLSGLDHKWGGANVCAVCGFDFDAQYDEPPEDEDEGHEVPLLLFRGVGDNCQMLALCWKCAEPRMLAKGGQPGAG